MLKEVADVVNACYRQAIIDQLSRPIFFQPAPKPVEEPEFWTWLCDVTTPDPLDDDEYDW